MSSPDSRTLPVLRTASSADTSHSRERMQAEVVSLFDQFREPLLRYLASLGLAFPDGEEVLQEVFLALFLHLNAGKSRENLRGWLFRVAHNLALKRRTRTRQDLPVDDTVIEPGPNPEDQLLRSQIRVRLMAVVKALPEQDRECLFLRAEGLRYREIAGILDMSLGAVSLSLARSLARIARAAER
jgi:RNA polymerase sigma-70 factor (ECF subfamily)